MDIEKYGKMLVGSEEERAVSPVIGVILMVAITVILAAVIAAFVLDMGDQMGESGVNAAVDYEVDSTGDNLTVSVTDLGNADGITVVNDSGQVHNSTRVLDSTGQSITYSVTSGETYTIQAYTGSVSDNSSIDDQVDSVSVINTVET